jgi:hypothetical protein
VSNLAARIFLAPGDLVADILHVTAVDDRTMIRTLINMLVWNLVIIVVGFLVYRGLR